MGSTDDGSGLCVRQAVLNLVVVGLSSIPACHCAGLACASFCLSFSLCSSHSGTGFPHCCVASVFASAMKIQNLLKRMKREMCGDEIS